MKKTILLLSCLIAVFGSANAQKTQTSTIKELLDRIETVNNLLVQEPENLFSQEEKLRLQEHFNTENHVPLNENNATNDIYAVSIFGGCERGFGTFPTSGPYDLDFITETTTKFYAGDKDGEDNLYGVRSDQMDENAFLMKIDPTTGDEIEIGRIDLESPHVGTGLAWNNANDTMCVEFRYLRYQTLYY